MSCVSYDKSFPDAVRATAREVKRSASLNLAAVHLKLQAWKDAEESCNKARALHALRAARTVAPGPPRDW